MCFANVEGGLDVKAWIRSPVTRGDPCLPRIRVSLVQVKGQEGIEKFDGRSWRRFRHHRQTDRRSAMYWYRKTASIAITSASTICLTYGTNLLMRLDVKQSGSVFAGNRFENYKMQPVQFQFTRTLPGSFLLTDSQRNAALRTASRRGNP